MQLILVVWCSFGLLASCPFLATSLYETDLTSFKLISYCCCEDAQGDKDCATGELMA